jgi:histidinol dehydrogenase
VAARHAAVIFLSETADGPGSVGAADYPGRMLRRTDLRSRPLPATAALRALLPRAAVNVDAVVERVRPIIDDVRARGAEAALELSERFDRVRPAAVRAPAPALAAALEALDPAVRTALETSVERARTVHADQRRTDVVTQVVPGGVVSERFVPVRRVGLYAPGGLAVYPSSVVMNVVPAQVAGVESLVVVSPPQAEHGGLPHPTILAAAALLGVDEVWAVGGAQAVALLAYGGADADGAELEPVDMVTGPGNAYVTAAKRLLRGLVGIDAEAGPTEIAVLADDTADPVHVAADLVSQAEHDPSAASVLVTTSEELADAVDAELERQVDATKHTERIRTALTGPQSGAVVVGDVEAGIAVVDAYAAEHLEIQTQNAREVALQVRNAGAIFVGPWAPVSLGDYCAGSNHVLPTGGCARHSAGLSVQTFLRGVHLIEYTEDALREVADRVVTLATAEDLPAHGEAVTARFREVPVGGAG